MHTFHPINQYKFRRRATRNVHSKRGELYQAISQGQNISSFCVTSCHLFALPIFLWFATSAALSTWKHEYGRTHVTFWRLRREKKKVAKTEDRAWENTLFADWDEEKSCDKKRKNPRENQSRSLFSISFDYCNRSSCAVYFCTPFKRLNDDFDRHSLRIRIRKIDSICQYHIIHKFESQYTYRSSNNIVNKEISFWYNLLICWLE